MSNRTFADVVHDAISFSNSVPSQALALDLIDTRWFQRLRDISQTANTRLVFMFSEHSRFGHSVGVAYLAELVLERFEKLGVPDITFYRPAITAAALLHDVGHLAPGSHMAFKCWFPNQVDSHEELGCRIIKEDPEIQEILYHEDPSLPERVQAVLTGDATIPPWCSELLAGGGWNVDRGNWLAVDSAMAGVSYGMYNVGALIESLLVTPDGHMALTENRLDAMLHFAVSRHAMYRQMYQHRVIMSADTLNQAIVKRARAVRSALPFVDDWMDQALAATTPEDLSLATMFQMRESWWRYHISRWAYAEDGILRDLCRRLLERRLFKTVAVHSESEEQELRAAAIRGLEAAGLDPDYYLFSTSISDVHSRDTRDALVVIKDNKEVVPLGRADPLLRAMRETTRKRWLVMPSAIKATLGRIR